MPSEALLVLFLDTHSASNGIDGGLNGLIPKTLMIWDSLDPKNSSDMGLR